MEFRDYQLDIISRGCSIIKKHGFLYLAMEVRTGKTLTAMGVFNELNIKKLLFLTKKKAISSIQEDYKKLSPGYDIIVVNYESLHKVDVDSVDGLVLDEAHSMGAFPKPSKRSKQVHGLIMKLNNPFVILMSGTPTPESYSQMYHQVYGIKGNPFSEYKNFYRFCDDYVDVKQKKINGFMINDYSRGSEDITKAMSPYTISYTQKQAGFTTEIEEDFLFVPLGNKIGRLIEKLKKDLVVEGNEEVILADTGAKLMSKVHQLCSGTVIFESGNYKVLSHAKAEYIKWKFDGEKIGIFYKFKAELQAIKDIYGDDITEDIEEFDRSPHKSIALQIVSGREGISLRNAKYLVFYNIDFSATSYWQARDRMTTKERTFNKVYWVFSKEGIEREIYNTVNKKKNFTLSHFRRNFLS